MNRFFIIMAVSALSLASCAKDDPKAGTVKAKSCNHFSAEQSVSEVTSSADTVILSVASNVEWTVKCEDSLAFSVTEGCDSCEVLVAVPENLSFAARRFSYSISTADELDVDDPQIWTEFGRTLNFTIDQAGIEPEFRIDRDTAKVASTDVSAEFILVSNLGCSVECLTENLDVNVTQNPESPFVYDMSFTFPANMTDEVIYYKAIVRAVDTLVQTDPIDIVIRQGAYVTLTLDCTNAANFRYDNAGTASALPTSNHGKDFVTCDFWQLGYEDYVFSGSVKNWGGTLNAAGNSPVKLPHIEGYRLIDVEITYSKASAVCTYSVTDGENTLGSCKMSASSAESSHIDISASAAASQDRYLVSSREMCAKFNLTYLSVL